MKACAAFLGKASLLLAALLVSPPAGLAGPDEEPAGGDEPVQVTLSALTRFELENGLTALLRPLRGAAKTAILVLYDVGEDHDPPGRSGLSHLVEHCYVTAAAGTAPARTAEQMMRAYPRAWNAQTGSDYTVLAFLVPPSALEDELRDAAARMGALEITQADLDREKPRMEQELAHMYEAIPALAARNHARERVRPSAAGARKGGVEAQIAALTLEDVRDWHARLYKPVNATLVVAGDFEAGTVRGQIEALFGPIAGGERPPEPPPRRAPSYGKETLRLGSAGQPGSACLAWAAPAPGGEDYPAFLVLLARFWRQSQPVSRGALGFTPYDDAHFVPYVVPVAAGGDGQAELEAAEEQVEAVLSGPFAGDEVGPALDSLAFFFGTAELHDEFLAQNPYAVAFFLARREQLGLDPEALAARIRGVDAEAFAAMAARVFSPARRAAVVVLPK